MRSIPFGYRVENGMAVIDEEEGAKVRQAFQLYLAGRSLRSISKELCIGRGHGGISKILEDKKYLGTSYYPPIIEKELFEGVREIRAQKIQKYAKPERVHLHPQVITCFHMKWSKKAYEDPFEQAQYVFSLIQPKER